MLLDTHQDLSFRTGFFGLNHVKVHLVAVKVSVVWSTYSEVKPERVPLHDTNFVHHHGHAVKRRLSVEDSNVTIDEVALNLKTWLGVSIAVEGREAVFDTGSLFAPFVEWTATVRTSDLKVFRERFWVRVVGLSQFVHPTVVEDSPWVILWQLFAVFIKSLEVVQRRHVVDCIGHFFFSHSSQRNLLLNHKSG